MARSKVKPDTERRLSSLQEEYLQAKPNSSEHIHLYQKIFSEILPYSRSLVLKKTSGKVYLPPELVDNIALDATVKFMSQYEKPSFRVDSSFAGLLAYKVLESMYGPKVIAADQISSLNDHIENGRTSDTEIGDLQESFKFTYLFRPDGDIVGEEPINYLFNKEQDAIDSVLTMIRDLYSSVDLHTYFLVVIGIYQFLTKNRMYERYKKMFLDKKMIEMLDLSLLEIYQRLKGVA